MASPGTAAVPGGLLESPGSRPPFLSFPGARMSIEATLLRILSALVLSGLVPAPDLPAAAPGAGTPPLAIEDRLLPPACSGPRKEGTEVSVVVIHFISNAKQSPENPHDVEAVLDIFREYTLSSHYLIDREGTVYRLVPEERRAWHAGKGKLPNPPHHGDTLNEVSIGIELLAVGTGEEMEFILDAEEYARIPQEHAGFTEKQYASLLLDGIRERHPKVRHDRRHVVGHDEYAPGRKTDPGTLFDWSAIGLGEKR